MAKIYIIAGEISGDFIGAKIIQNLKQLHSNIELLGIGGPQMIETGLKTLFSINEINMMGFFEILPHIFRLKKRIIQTAQNITSHSPEVLITIDSPGFTYRVAKLAKTLNPKLKMVHIVAPSVWAYKPERAAKYAQIYDHLLALLPFEPPYFEQVGLACTYIGHPIIQQHFYPDKKSLREEFTIEATTKVISVTPGSRIGEISRHMPVFRKALDIISKNYIDLMIIFVLANKEHKKIIDKFLVGSSFKYSFGDDKLKSFAVADVALAKSGTNILEIAASNTPMVVAYKLNQVSFWLLKRMIKIKYASLVNIIANEEVLPELIQANCSAQNIAKELLKLLDETNNKAREQTKKTRKILEILGFYSAEEPSMVAAKLIMEKFL